MAVRWGQGPPSWRAELCALGWKGAAPPRKWGLPWGLLGCPVEGEGALVRWQCPG